MTRVKWEKGQKKRDNYNAIRNDIFAKLKDMDFKIKFTLRTNDIFCEHVNVSYFREIQVKIDENMLKTLARPQSIKQNCWLK